MQKYPEGFILKENIAKYYHYDTDTAEILNVKKEPIHKAYIESGKMKLHAIGKEDFFHTLSTQDQEIHFVKRPISNNDWITGLFILVFILLAFVRSNFNRRFKNLIRSFFSRRLENQFLKEGNVFKERLVFPLMITFLLVISLFVYQSMEFFNLNLKKDAEWHNFLFIFTSIAAIILGRAVLRYSLGTVFRTLHQTYEQMVNIFIYDVFNSLLLIPLIIIAAYNPVKNVFITGFVLIITIYLLRIVRLTIIGAKNTKFSGYYLFLYLCTAEIIPVLVIGKLAYMSIIPS